MGQEPGLRLPGLLREGPGTGPQHLLGVYPGVGERGDQRLLDEDYVGTVRGQGAQLPGLLHRLLPAFVESESLHQVLQSVEISVVLRATVPLHYVGVDPECHGVHGEGSDDGGAHAADQTARAL